MTPPAKITVPLRLKTPERSQTSRVAHIIESVLKLQEEEDLSPTTKGLGDEVRRLALDSLEEIDGNIGREDFTVFWRIFEHLVKSKNDTQRKALPCNEIGLCSLLVVLSGNLVGTT